MKCWTLHCGIHDSTLFFGKCSWSSWGIWTCYLLSLMMLSATKYERSTILNVFCSIPSEVSMQIASVSNHPAIQHMFLLCMLHTAEWEWVIWKNAIVKQPAWSTALICWSSPRFIRSGQHLKPAERLNVLFMWRFEPARCFLCFGASIFIADVAVMPFPSRVYGCVQGNWCFITLSVCSQLLCSSGVQDIWGLIRNSKWKKKS